MKNLFLTFIVLTIKFYVLSQLNVVSQKYDFDRLMAYSPRFIDVEFKNSGLKKEYILRVECPSEVKYLKSSDLAMPDSSVIVRLQANPKKKGRFSYEIKVFTSDKAEPIKLTIFGIMDEPPYNETTFMQECPNFDKAPGRNSNFKIKVTTVDRATGIAIGTSSVVLVQGGFASPPYVTNKKGFFEKKGQMGYMFFYAEHPEYVPAEMGAMINPDRSEIVILMDRNTLVAKVTETVIEKQPETKIENPKIESEILISDDVPEIFEIETTSEFSLKDFKPINVVFVLDISGSMKSGDRMELLKFSLMKISGMLRSCDRISLVTYATDAKTLLSPISGSDKELVSKLVQKLEANGSTAGSAGIKLGYKTAQSAYLADGMNHIIVITDGAFNKGKSDYQKVVTKNRKKGYSMSVVGIRNSELAGKQMSTAAEIGGGAFVSIQSLKDAGSLLNNEVKRLTKR